MNGPGRAGAIADDVRSGRRSAASVVEAALSAAAGRGIELGAVTRVLRERATAQAARIDAELRQAGIPARWPAYRSP